MTGASTPIFLISCAAEIIRISALEDVPIEPVSTCPCKSPHRRACFELLPITVYWSYLGRTIS